jgi:hypothetical protein
VETDLPSPPPPVAVPSAAEPTTSVPQRGVGGWLADAAIAVALVAAVLIVFVLDRRGPAMASALERKYAGNETIFDPLARPVAELRENPQRQQWIGAFGGSDKSEEAVVLGLDWLARHQESDGHWGPDCIRAAPAGCCLPSGACGGAGSDHRLAQTGLAILAMQAAGHYDFNRNEHSDRVRRGLNWLLQCQKADGCFLDAGHGAGQCNMYEHGIAAFALADACEMADSLGREPEDRFRQAAQRAIQFIEYAQHEDGGWRYTPERHLPSDVSVSGWQVLALKAAKRAKIVEVGEQCVERIETFFKRCEVGSRGRTAYMPGQTLSDATTGVGMLVHQFILERPNSPLVREAAQYLAAEAERAGKNQAARRRSFAAANRDFYTWYNCTLAMFQAGGEPWKRWNNVVRDLVVSSQRRDENCARGSWDPQGRWSPEGGRIYSTALAVLTLEVYYRYKSQRAQVYDQRAQVSKEP